MTVLATILALFALFALVASIAGCESRDGFDANRSDWRN